MQRGQESWEELRCGNGGQSPQTCPRKDAHPKARDGKRFWLKPRAYEDRGKRSKGNTMAPGQGCS